MRARVAVVGVGYMGSLHAAKYKRMEDVELVAVVDPDSDRGKTVAKALDCPYFHSVDAMLGSRTHCEFASVAAPTHSHHSIATALLKAGIHCLIEKPLAATAMHAQALVDLAKRKGVILIPGHIERFNPAVRAVKRQAPRIRYVKGYRVGPMSFRSTDVDVIKDVMLHDVDIVFHLIGGQRSDVRVDIVRAISSPEGLNDVANVHFNINDECSVDLTASRLAVGRRSKLRIFCSDSYYSIDCGARRAMKLDRTDYFNGLRSLQLEQAMGRSPNSDEIFAAVGAESLSSPGQGAELDPLAAEIRYFISCARKGKAMDLLSAEDGVAVLIFSEKILKFQKSTDTLTSVEGFR